MPDNAREFGQNFVVVILVLVIVVLSMALMLALIWYVFRPLAGNATSRIVKPPTRDGNLPRRIAS